MDEQQLRAELMARATVMVDEMIAAMQRAPAGNIVGGSEWEVHGVAERCKRDCFQSLVNARVREAVPERTAFSPGASGGRGQGAADA